MADIYKHICFAAKSHSDQLFQLAINPTSEIRTDSGNDIVSLYPKGFKYGKDPAIIQEQLIISTKNKIRPEFIFVMNKLAKIINADVFVGKVAKTTKDKKTENKIISFLAEAMTKDFRDIVKPGFVITHLHYHNFWTFPFSPDLTEKFKSFKTSDGTKKSVMLMKTNPDGLVLNYAYDHDARYVELPLGAYNEYVFCIYIRKSSTHISESHYATYGEHIHELSDRVKQRRVVLHMPKWSKALGDIQTTISEHTDDLFQPLTADPKTTLMGNTTILSRCIAEYGIGSQDICEAYRAKSKDPVDIPILCKDKIFEMKCTKTFHCHIKHIPTKSILFTTLFDGK
jgi:hypothetical protein|uniref:Serpin domain-containing protein n=1 Tax=viral metagenome TaxID=1070528 RepID=A0A6C0IV11_9ZZZZ